MPLRNFTADHAFFDAKTLLSAYNRVMVRMEGTRMPGPSKLTQYFVAIVAPDRRRRQPGMCVDDRRTTRVSAAADRHCPHDTWTSKKSIVTRRSICASVKDVILDHAHALLGMPTLVRI